ncbi:MAG: hypothetical protein H7282_04670 [Cytophagaceae bacterium]|nr:hypothetical protein [Cytophagaceae bacterium]
MKSYLIIFICLCILSSCKKKEDAPQPVPADKLLYETTYADASWTTRSTSKSASSYNSETFRIAIDTVNWMAYELAPYYELDNMYAVQVDVKLSLTDNTKLGYAGFIYNYIDTDNYCVMQLCNNGTFFAYQVKMGTGIQLFYNTVSKDLKKGPDQTNTIAIRQGNNSQEFILNGISQGTFPFKQERGYVRVGVLATTYPSYYTPLVATFDNFVIKKIY